MKFKESLYKDIVQVWKNKKISKNWRIRYVESYYFYRLEKHTTLSLYSRLAKKRRYGKEAILPEKMDPKNKGSNQRSSGKVHSFHPYRING